MIFAIVLFIFGVALLIIGAKFLVSGASQLARTLKISSLIIGLTIVAFGTSAPEIGVSALAAWRNEGGLAVGNIVGSNIINILVVLGLCATITPLLVKRQLIRWDVPLMIALSALFWLLASAGKIYRWEGILLLLGIIIYLLFAYRIAKRENHDGIPKPIYPVWLQCVLILLGLVCIAFGSEFVTTQAVAIARLFEVQELFIGLTLVALSTSLPEITTSLVAISKKERDLAVGNVIGSNIFNILAVLGIAATIAPQPISVPPAAIAFDLPVMVAVAIATLPIFLTGHKISRWEGLLFLFYYALYLCYLILQALSHPLLPLFTTAFFFFILPLTLLTLVIGVVRHFQKK